MGTSRRLLRVAAPFVALGLLALPGCPEEPVRQTGAVGAGNVSAGNTGSGGATQASTSSGGSGGQGGSACLSCGEFFVNSNFTASLAQTCGYDASSQMCALGSSCDIIATLDACACGEPPGVPGLCDAVCTLRCTGGGTDDPGCQDCITTQCAGESTLCNADPGTP